MVISWLEVAKLHPLGWGSLFPTHVQLGTELRFHNRQRSCWGYTRSKKNGARTWEPNCISQANPNPRIHLHNLPRR